MILVRAPHWKSGCPIVITVSSVSPQILFAQLLLCSSIDSSENLAMYHTCGPVVRQGLTFWVPSFPFELWPFVVSLPYIIYGKNCHLNSSFFLPWILLKLWPCIAQSLWPDPLDLYYHNFTADLFSIFIFGLGCTPITKMHVVKLRCRYVCTTNIKIAVSNGLEKKIQ